MAKYKTILFDLDGTLIDSSECIVQAVHHAFVTSDLPPPEADLVISRMGIPIERNFRDFTGNLLSDEEIASLVQQFRRRYLALCPELLVIFPGIKNLMESLHSMGREQYIVTSKKREPAIANCKQVGIAEFLLGYIGSDSVTNHKPHAESVHAALKLTASFSLEETIVVGDSAFDIEMGNSAGVHTCAVTWGAHDVETLRSANPTYIATTVEELHSILVDAP